MQRLLVFLVGGALLAATAAALASAAGTAPLKASAAPAEGANAYLPTGVKPAVNDWLWPGGDESSTGFSQLRQINSSNAGNLKVAWNASYNLPTDTRSPQSQPICCPLGNMYLTILTGVVAINPSDGSIVWKYQGPAFNTIRSATSQVGIARSETFSPKWNYLYSGQQDGSLVALNAKTGAPVWTVQVSGTGTYGSATGAESEPFTQFYDDGGDGIILSSPNGGESPFRGHVDAYNAKTGQLVWRSWNTPDPTQLPYILTWSNPAEAATGGAATWSIPAVDPQLGLVYYGTGNLYPWTGRQPGDDLWGTALMAVDWKTGALRWYWQEIKHDIWDLDSPNPPARFNVPINGKMVPVVAEGGKDGYLYVRNAKTGGPVPNFGFKTIPTYDPTGRGAALNGLSSTQVIPTGAAGCIFPVDWTTAGLSACGFPTDLLKQQYGGASNINVQPDGTLANAVDGIPIVGTVFGAAHTRSAYFVFGGGAGGGVMGYPRKAYNPITHNLYICYQGQSTGHSNQGNSSNTLTLGPSFSNTPGTPQAGYVAVNMTNNTVAWRQNFDATLYGNCYSGSMTTAGNLAITGTVGPLSAALMNTGKFPNGTASLNLDGYFLVFDATTGKILFQWQIPVPAGATSNSTNFGAPAITYMFKGKQYIAIYHGLPAGSPYRDQLTVFSL
jgi:glucose dehydrogenase